MSKRKKPSPKLTVWFPPNEECPDDWTTCYQDALQDIIKEIIQEHVAKGIERARGLSNLKWDLIIMPVRAEIITPFNIYEFEWPSEDWPCLDGFLGMLRRRLDELFDPLRAESAELFKSFIDVEAIGRRAWNAYILPRLKDIRETERLLGAEAAKKEIVSSILGLERGERAFRQLAPLAGIRLSRWDTPAFKGIVLIARELLR